MTRGAQDAIKSIAMNQIVGAIKSGLDVWVNSIDRTAVINAAGSGDMLGASLAERQRRTNFASGAMNTAGATAQGLGLALAPFTGGISLLVGTGINLLTNVASGLTEAEQKKYANKIAYSSLWDDKKEQAMNLAAIMGDPKYIREAFQEAADAAAKFGFSAEEGADAIKQSLQQGLKKNEAITTAEQIFQYERSTGADRGTLSSVANMAARYGMGDPLKAAWGGLHASGMSTGQYSEYLRATKSILEDGISKGFSKSADQVATNLTMLSQMTGNNPLWQGENGARRLMDMNAGLERATGLGSTSDIVAYRAARNILGDKYTDYTDAMMVMEKGLTPELFKEYMRLTEGAEGSGNREGIVERMRQTFGLNYTNARKLYDNRDYLAALDSDKLKAELDRYKTTPLPALPERGGKDEYNSLVETMEVRNLVIKSGQGFWDKEFWNAMVNAKREYQEVSVGLVPGAGNTDVPMPGTEIPFNIREKIPEIRNMPTTVLPKFFGHGGDRRSDNAAEPKFDSIFTRAANSNNDDELDAAYRSLSIMQKIPKSVSEQWDKEDKLNPLADSGNAREFLTALNRLIEVTENLGHIEVRYE
jgi:hypothetical protein